MKKKELDLVKLAVTEDGEVSTKIYHQLRDDLSDEQLDRILDHMDKIAKVIEELEEEME